MFDESGTPLETALIPLFESEVCKGPYDVYGTQFDSVVSASRMPSDFDSRIKVDGFNHAPSSLKFEHYETELKDSKYEALKEAFLSLPSSVTTAKPALLAGPDVDLTTKILQEDSALAGFNFDLT